jgi:hypothetical protein
VDLFSEFPSRHDDECPDLVRWADAETLQDGENESCGFPGAGLCQAKDVAPLEHNRDCLLLNRGRCDIARGFDTCDYARVERKLFEMH